MTFYFAIVFQSIRTMFLFVFQYHGSKNLKMKFLKKEEEEEF